MTAPAAAPAAAPAPTAAGAGGQQNDLAAFQAPQFTPGHIPETPPPPSLCY